MKRYPDMRDTELSWTNSLPAHWDERRGKFLFDLKKRPIREEDDVITAFRDGQVTLRTNRRTEGFTNSLKEIGYQGVREGDLVIHAMDGFAGAIGVSDSDGKCSPVYSCCVGRSGINADFYAYLLRNMAKTGFIESLAKGIRERSTDFRWNDFAELGLPLPPAHEQTHISTALDRETARIDALIEQKTRFIELLKEKRQALITQAVTKGLDPNVPMRDSGVEWIGEVPEGWGTCRVKHVARIKYGIGEPPQYFEDGTRLIRATNVKNGYISDIGMVFVRPTDIPSKRIIWLTPGNIIVVRSGAYTADSAIVREQDCPAIAGFDMVITATRADPEFLHFVLLSNYVKRDQLDQKKLRAAQPHLNSEELGDTEIVMPSLKEQAEIVGNLKPKLEVLGKLNRATLSSIDLLKERRSALITAAVTGQIDLREAA